MGWNRQSLGMLIEQSGYDRAGEDDYPVLSITMKHGLVDQSDKFKKRVASQDTSKYRIAYKNELVVGFPIDEGVLGFQTRYSAGIVSPAYDIWKLKNEVEVHIPYLERYLRSPQARRLYASKMQGAVARRRSLTKSDFLKLEIPIPIIEDQIRIAHLLSKVEGLIAQRKENLQQLDELLKSVFLEIFGDPVRNEKAWDKPELKKFGKISTGNTPPRNDASSYSSRHIEWIKTDNIPSDSVYITQATEYLSESGSKKGRIITEGAILIACIAGSVESIGRAALTNRTVSFNQQINAIQPSKDVNSFFLYGLFKISKAYIQSHATKGMKKILTKGDFEKIKMIKPPIGLQDSFANIVEKIESVKLQYKQNLADLENLFGALSQKAFKGELDLSRVSLPATVDLSDSDQIHNDKLDDLNLKSIKADTAKSTDNIGNPAPFTNKSFEEFLRTHKDEVLTAAALWRELKQVNFENPPNFESFKNLVMDYLDEGRWLEQVYAEVPVDDEVNVNKFEELKEKKVALRIRDDS